LSMFSFVSLGAFFLLLFASVSLCLMVAASSNSGGLADSAGTSQTVLSSSTWSYVLTLAKYSTVPNTRGVLLATELVKRRT